MKKLPLDGIVVLDLSHILSGPYGSLCLADMGASVIKIEPPTGDAVRRNPPFVEGMSTAFELINRNKESLQIDLKSTEGKGAFRRLVAKADVVVENFRPGKMSALGFGYEALTEINPRLIMASISGFGQTGPYADLGGYDLMAQAVSGIMSVTGAANGPPTKCGLPITDISAGLFMVQGILLALLQREKTGVGQYIDVSLYDSAIALSVWQAAGYWGWGIPPARIGNSHPFMAPYDVFKTLDGHIVAAGHDNLWPKFCELLGLQHLKADPRFSDNAKRVENRSALNAIVEERMSRETSAHWLSLLEKAHLPAAPIRSYDEVYKDPHTLARGTVVERPGRFPTFGSPIKMSGVQWSVRHEAPRLGVDSAAVLARFGFSPSEITHLEELGVINVSKAPQ
jgi:crotonobetainyl-CoA:carnitine CoA-transferase CaiB-like acyl-CoA transferase